MKQHILIFLTIIIGFNTVTAQRKAETTQIEIKPINGKGFYGTLDFVYAFSDCFGDAQMLYTYKNVQTNQFHYNGKVYRPRDLGLSNFNKYILTPDITINVMQPLDFFKNGQPRYGGIEGGRQNSIKGNIKLTTVLDQQLAGCYGQTHKLGKVKNINPKYLYIARENKAFLHYNSLLIDLIKCKENPEKCNEEKKIEKDNIKPLKSYEITAYGNRGNNRAYYERIEIRFYLKSNCNKIELESKIEGFSRLIFRRYGKNIPFQKDYIENSFILVHSVEKIYNEVDLIKKITFEGHEEYMRNSVINDPSLVPNATVFILNHQNARFFDCIIHSPINCNNSNSSNNNTSTVIKQQKENTKPDYWNTTKKKPKTTKTKKKSYWDN